MAVQNHIYPAEKPIDEDVQQRFGRRAATVERHAVHVDAHHVPGRDAPLMRARNGDGDAAVFQPVGIIARPCRGPAFRGEETPRLYRSEEHTSELQSLMRISYAVFCLKKTKKTLTEIINDHSNKIQRTLKI